MAPASSTPLALALVLHGDPDSRHDLLALLEGLGLAPIHVAAGAGEAFEVLDEESPGPVALDLALH